MSQKPVKPKILAAWPKYKADHKRDPSRYPMTRAAYARALNISPSHFSKPDEDIQKIAREIDLIDAERGYAGGVAAEKVNIPPPDKAAVSDTDYASWLAKVEGDGPRGMRDEALAQITDQYIRRAQRSMAQFASRSKPEPGESIADPPLVLYELERTVEALHKAIRDLKPLIAERRRRDIDGYARTRAELERPSGRSQ